MLLESVVRICLRSDVEMFVMSAWFVSKTGGMDGLGRKSRWQMDRIELLMEVRGLMMLVKFVLTVVGGAVVGMMMMLVMLLTTMGI